MRRADLLAILGLALLACSAGDADPPHPDGSAEPAPAPGNALENPTLQERLAALGYVASEPLPERTGVTLHDPTRARPGWNLVVSQHGQEAALLDMCGETLHTWRQPRTERDGDAVLSWRTVHLFPNGDVLAQTDFGPLTRLTRDSRVLWKFQGRTHHDFDLRDDGRILVLTQRDGRFPGFGRISQDFIVELDPRGGELRRVSILQALLDGRQTELLGRIRGFQRDAEGLARLDVTHANALEILDGRLEAALPAFRSGNVLVSVLTIDRLLVVDLDAGRVVWSLAGSFDSQHHPTVVDGGNLLLFDNLGLAERSRALEIDPVTGEQVWSYGGGEGEAFFSQCCGRVHRLDNGNTLIVESQPGRAFEVTPDGAIVWEYHNPHEVGGRVAILHDVVRIDPERARWLDPKAAGRPCGAVGSGDGAKPRPDPGA